MSGHRQRVIPKRLWAEGERLGFYDEHELDPRTDPRDGADIYADELMLAEFQRDMRKARKEQQESTK